VDVASGRLDGFWEFGPDAGNLIGSSLIAREAGAIVCTASGDPWTPDADSFLAAPPGLSRQAVAILSGCLLGLALEGMSVGLRQDVA
jgi:myo-inositol-1(or 4)-monophosphatase